MPAKGDKERPVGSEGIKDIDRLRTPSASFSTPIFDALKQLLADEALLIDGQLQYKDPWIPAFLGQDLGGQAWIDHGFLLHRRCFEQSHFRSSFF